MEKIFFFCICSKKYFLLSNYEKNITINICKNCHPYYTKKKNLLDASKKMKSFNKKYENFFKKK
ncbi:50S ribosomal protein L31 [Candidatus Carsonella ruddii]|uniref:50S ribosomal protein L31 n=1 Tax=Carsonella ruddii TaxID=114186 RepID=A0AAE7KM92_CARRU|nr:50S ribosomal protein L31 [Candidatus Carsonella ruddii]AGS06517.1 50S ribosomal protein L31 [Candidatus Carsonella ruddii DC]QLK13999.1 50S ribosomal protein L31 [Candidatus Carsonella ruddii]